MLDLLSLGQYHVGIGVDLNCHHATPDIHTHRSRYYGVLGDHDGTDSGSVSKVHVRHDSHMLMGYRQVGDIPQLLDGPRFNSIQGSPQLDRYFGV
jgi:hypothetical protein